PLPLKAVMKAKDFLIDPQNHRIVTTKPTQRPARKVFNSTKSMVAIPAVFTSINYIMYVLFLMTCCFLYDKFQRSLRGGLGGEVPILDIQFTFLSLYQVTLHEHHLAQMEDLPLQSMWRSPKIVSVRKAMSCTCKSYKHSGWVCSHVIASLHLLDKLNIERALETMPMRGPPGRLKSTRGGLNQTAHAMSIA
ncbi:hypothetical protein L914_21319, partial [Phytophthora nicotianae]